MKHFLKQSINFYRKRVKGRLPYWLLLFLVGLGFYSKSGWKVFLILSAIAFVGGVADILIVHSEEIWPFTFPKWWKTDLLNQILQLNLLDAEKIVNENIERYFLVQKWPSEEERETPYWQDYLSKLHETQQRLFRCYFSIIWPNAECPQWCLGPAHFTGRVGKRFIALGTGIITEPGKSEIYIGGRWRRLQRYPSIYHFLALLIKYSQLGLNQR